MWLGVNQYNPDDICSICHENYGTSQAIYKTPCNHVFHNNCLNQYCEMYEGNIVCPICRSDLGDSCMDVWAFKEMALTDRDDVPLPFQSDEHILNIYRNQAQVPQQGGKKRRSRRTKNRRTKNRTRKGKNRKSKNKKSKKRRTKRRIH